MRHPTTAHWRFPPADRPALPAPLHRVNLRELMARPARFEHHLTVVARVAQAQLEVVVASEPLYFAHVNISDEYALSLKTGDPELEAVPFLTLLSDPETGTDLGRIKHRVGDLVLHPHGLLHWPGRLRPPHATIPYPPGTRRTGLNLVFCASEPCAPVPARPLFVSPGREAATKAYTEPAPPFLLAEVHAERPRELAQVGGASMHLLVDPAPITAPTGAYVVVLDADSSLHHPGDLIHVPPAATLPTQGLHRALLISAPVAPEPPPPVWHHLPEPPFPPFEDGPREPLPIDIGPMRVTKIDADTVRVDLNDHHALVPRYWLARALFRVALHDYALNYVETYGGFYYDERSTDHRLGLRGAGFVSLPKHTLAPTIERLYRAVAPDNYIERVT